MMQEKYGRSPWYSIATLLLCVPINAYRIIVSNGMNKDMAAAVYRHHNDHPFIIRTSAAKKIPAGQTMWFGGVLPSDDATQFLLYGAGDREALIEALAPHAKLKEPYKLFDVGTGAQLFVISEQSIHQPESPVVTADAATAAPPEVLIEAPIEPVHLEEVVATPAELAPAEPEHFAPADLADTDITADATTEHLIDAPELAVYVAEVAETVEAPVVLEELEVLDVPAVLDVPEAPEILEMLEVVEAPATESIELLEIVPALFNVDDTALTYHDEVTLEEAAEPLQNSVEESAIIAEIMPTEATSPESLPETSLDHDTSVSELNQEEPALTQNNEAIVPQTTPTLLSPPPTPIHPAPQKPKRMKLPRYKHRPAKIHKTASPYHHR